ncbi:GNAT family N-acetyltransferase [Bacillus sp. 7586-K]|uniref:Ribosomal protein S18 acetylase RimI-like enzyme n=1 Tax=Metabacillus niabensis TaxID=324854 RepID=A0ABT9Z0H1_9BACI|nr:GNAT family N-acetyltransferase [Metabacillus niabensis]MDQ0225351.1 ribosomal protein S18 acetylase RimI-like enzyme [Metabacillus niabensis]PAD71096.1 GNAT family N-acetyltransferase [Bacillus sp. 7586-K]
MNVVEVKNLPNHLIVDFFTEHWGSPEMVISSGIYDCSSLDGFAVVEDKDKIVGLITYIIENNECEIISLDSVKEGQGIGSLLVKEVENLASKKICKLVKLITTNDNLLALKFYQKRGFILSKIINNAVEKARKLKPEIPLIGNEGIPIRDEIELIKKLT